MVVCIAVLGLSAFGVVDMTQAKKEAGLQRAKRRVHPRWSAEGTRKDV